MGDDSSLRAWWGREGGGRGQEGREGGPYAAHVVLVTKSCLTLLQPNGL